MWALRKDYRTLSPGQRGALAQIAADNKQLYKGYLIKEQLREAVKAKGEDGKRLLRGMIAWAHRCRIPEFQKLARTLSRLRDLIDHTLDGGPSNGRAEALNSPDQRPDHQSPRVPQRRRPHRHGPVRPRRPVPPFTLLT